VKNECDDPQVHMALVQIDPEGKECVPALISALDHADYHVVDIAANCLGLLGRQANDAAPALAAAMTRDFDEEFSNDYDPRASAAKALRRIGPQAKPVVPALIGALKYRLIVRSRDGSACRDHSAAAAPAEVLGSFGAEAKAAIPALIEAVENREQDDESWLVRKAAILALGRMGPDVKTTIPVLRNLMTDERADSEYLPETLAALYQFAPDGKEVAEKWLEKPPGGWLGGQGHLSPRPLIDELEGHDTDREFSANFDRQASAIDGVLFLGLSPPKANKTVSFFVLFHQEAMQSGILFLVSIERGGSRRVYDRGPLLSDVSQPGNAPYRCLVRTGGGARRCRRTGARKTAPRPSLMKLFKLLSQA
jgi:hypothetical protein